MIIDSNRIIKVAESRHLGNALIITTKYVVLRYGVLTATYYGFSNLKIKGNFKIIIDCYNKKSSSSSSIIQLMKVT